VRNVAEQWIKRVAKILDVNFDETLQEESASYDFERLPLVSHETMEQYLHYLKLTLSFPFPAVYEQETGPFDSVEHQVKVVGIDDFIDDKYGLLCTAREGRRKRIVALAELIVAEKDPNYQYLDDYLSWFSNCR